MKQKIASYLLKIKAVTLRPESPFTWSSGIKSPIYCDNRLTLSYPEIRKQIAAGLGELIKRHFPETEVIAACATAGIPHAALVSDILQLPMCYVRSQAKEHGQGKQIEGIVKAGQKVVVVEDLISTGGSVIKVVDALQRAGCEVIGVVSIFTYELKAAAENFAALGVPVYSLTDFSALVQEAQEQGYINESSLHSLIEWRKSPENWHQNI